MERIREPELMDDPLQARVYAAADFASTDQAFTGRILALLAESGLAPSLGPSLAASSVAAPPLAVPPLAAPFLEASSLAAPALEASSLAAPSLAVPPLAASPEVPLRVLDLGCGPGNISFRLAAALPRAALLGLDGSAPMLALAEHQRQAAPHRWPLLRFHQARLPLADGVLEGLGAPFAPPYGLIVSNSLLHHLHDPAVLWRAVGQWAAPGALVVVRDLRRPASPEALQALVERHAATAPAVLRRDYAHSLAAAFRPAEVEAQLAIAGLSTLRVESLEDRYLEISGRWPDGGAGVAAPAGSVGGPGGG
jgi:SAM-dependent methyltransferase